MLQQTVLRLEGLTAAAPVVVCNEAHRFLVAEQLRQLRIEPRATILEPFGRNTAPAIALAAHAALRGLAADANAVDPVLLILPADHAIRDVPAFQQAVRVALPPAAASASRASSRSPTPSARASSSPPVTTTGTAACSCSVHAAICRSCCALPPRWRACAKPRGALHRLTSTSRALRRRASK